MTTKKSEARRKRDAVIEEVLRRLELMTDDAIEYEFTAIENALEVHVRLSHRSTSVADRRDAPDIRAQRRHLERGGWVGPLANVNDDEAPALVEVRGPKAIVLRERQWSPIEGEEHRFLSLPDR